MFIPDITRAFKLVFNDREIRVDRMIVWSTPKTVNSFKVLLSIFKQKVRASDYFVTSDDKLLMEILQNVDPEIILENKELMRKFESMYRFFASLDYGTYKIRLNQIDSFVGTFRYLVMVYSAKLGKLTEVPHQDSVMMEILNNVDHNILRFDENFIQLFIKRLMFHELFLNAVHT